MDTTIVRRDITNPPELKEGPLYAITITFTVIAILVTLVRLVVRWRTFRKLFVDDWIVVAAIIFLLAFEITFCLAVPYLFKMLAVLHHHKWPGPNFLHVVVVYFRFQYAICMLYWAALWSVKYSIMAFFYRLGSKIRLHMIIWWIVFVFTTLSLCGCIISYPFYCHTFKYAGNCTGTNNIRHALITLRYSAAVDILTTMAIVVIPVCLLWNVRIPLQKKITLLSLLCASGVTIVFAGIRLLIVDKKNSLPSGHWLALWSIIEIALALIICNLVSFRSLFVDSSAAASTKPAGSNETPQPTQRSSDRFFIIQRLYSAITGRSASRTNTRTSPPESKDIPQDLSSPATQHTVFPNKEAFLISTNERLTSREPELSDNEIDDAEEQMRREADRPWIKPGRRRVGDLEQQQQEQDDWSIDLARTRPIGRKASRTKGLRAPGRSSVHGSPTIVKETK